MAFRYGPGMANQGPAGTTQSTPTETDFGFRRVAEADKARLVRGVFDGVAGRYDLMNDLMSAGVHRLWKSTLIDWLAPRPYMHLLDVAGGTGDIAQRFRERGGGRVTVADINENMVRVGRERAATSGLANVDWVVGNAEALPLPDGTVDAVTIAFGIRNVTHIDRALAEMYRVLRPGGRFICLEFSHVVIPGLAQLYDAFSFNVIPRLGELVAGDAESYRYLVESIRKFPEQERFAGMLRDAGLERVQVRNLSGGIAALHSGWRL
jgi:demethylmenaquinone methyltransferase/2-methoxy-6-polyprenyl-1,4-benzoquinol methylase